MTESIIANKFINSIKGGPGSGNWDGPGKPRFSHQGKEEDDGDSFVRGDSKKLRDSLKGLASSNVSSTEIRQKIEEVIKKSEEKLQEYNDAIRVLDKKILDRKYEFLTEQDTGMSTLHRDKKYVDLINAKKKLTHLYDNDRVKTVELVVTALTQPSSTKANFKPIVIVHNPSFLKEGGSAVRSGNKEEINKYTEQLKALSSITHKSVSEKTKISIYVKEGRAYYHNNSITVSPQSTKDTTFHEMGHFIEEGNPAIGKAMREFFLRRTKGESIKPLSSVTGVLSYSKEEITKVDKFINAYMGKIYNTGVTEILSMGIQTLLTKPAVLMRKDPEYFDLVVDVLRGRIK